MEDLNGKQCLCISYNQPKAWQNHPQRILQWHCGTTADGEEIYKEIAVDECIADSVLILWENGIGTLGSCCGHGKMKPSIVLSREQDWKKAKELFPDFQICYWKLIER